MNESKAEYKFGRAFNYDQRWWANPQEEDYIRGLIDQLKNNSIFSRKKSK